MAKWLNPIELEGNLAKLIPLEEVDRSEVLQAASDGNLWELWYTSVPSKDNLDAYVDFALQQESEGLALPFVVIEKSSGKVVGSTRYCSVDAPNRRVEIGYTWYAQSVQRTGINTECKYLLLQHAFETLDAIAVEFKTNFFNFPSRNAILRLGAKQDGIIRNHRIDKMGNIRDTVIFSILNSEWPAVKISLEHKMKKKYS
ncbi:GNAT family N-acetyltransferase [Flagellimonas sp.]|uniref:GNAT family N-acetyltransferase n=1 Tax=Flagellimonas sp. TaxID=2058762 RepID=UPI003F4A6EC7